MAEERRLNGLPNQSPKPTPGTGGAYTEARSGAAYFVRHLTNRWQSVFSKHWTIERTVHILTVPSRAGAGLRPVKNLVNWTK